VILGAPTGGNTGAGTLNAISVKANGVTLTSDAALKQDISSMPPCLPLVQAVEPRAYRWTPLEDPLKGPADFSERQRWGFVAQDFAAGDPVRADANDEASLDAGALIAALWKAVQELSAKVAALEAKR
jgi:hypothetical protein